MAFDIDGARKAGYSDAEIADYLGKSARFDVAKARASGYSDAELIAHLSKSTKKDKTRAPPEEKPRDGGGMLSNVRRAMAHDIKFAAPAIEGLGAAGGAVLGAGSPIPGGAAIGAGLGYATGKAGTRAALDLLGYGQNNPLKTQLIDTAGDVFVGGSMEAGGQIAAPYIARGLGWVTDAIKGRLGPVRAAHIAKEAIGPDLPMIKDALRAAPDDMTAAQAAANINSPAWNALSSRAMLRDPRFFGADVTPQQAKQAANVFQNLTGGATATQQRAATEGAIRQLNERLIPTLETELNAANIAGRKLPVLQGQADRMAGAAASKVEDVRRFTSAGTKAAERAANTTLVPGYPMVPGRYTYMGELEKRAEQAAAKAAEASLPFGEAARFSQAAANSLAAHGLKPLESKPIQDALRQTAKRPEFAGNKDVVKALERVSSDIAEWTGKGGVIDAWALDSIRKNSVNAAIQDLYPAADKKVQKELAASVLTKVKPLIVDAIEKSGGTGYGKYLADYATGRQLINQGKLTAEAASLYKNNPKAFVDLVEGNNPDVVEKIFGPGNYQIVKEMSADAMQKLRGVADVMGRTIKAKEQADLGQTALREILEEHNPRMFKIPWGLSPKTMAMNKALDLAEKRIGKKTMNALTTGMRSGKNALQMLDEMPSKDRINILQSLQDPRLFPGVGSAVSTQIVSE